MTHDEMIAVIQAHKEGKVIEALDSHDVSDVWLSVPNPSWNFADFRYRVKPEPPKPREWWMCRYRNGETIAHDSRQSSQVSAVVNALEILEIVHVREVIEEK